MKKQLSILSLAFMVTLSFILASCGAKKDEALVTEFNSKKTEADSLMNTMMNGSKMMAADHAIWTMKLDSAAKAGADQAKVDDFKGQMKKMDDMGKNTASMDSLHAYMNAKTDNNDQLKAAIAGLSANLTACNTMCNSMMDMHKKLGADIMAFLGGAPAAAAPAKEEAKPKKAGEKAAAAPAANPNAPAMDMSKHAVKTPVGGTPRRGSGATIK